MRGGGEIHFIPSLSQKEYDVASIAAVNGIVIPASVSMVQVGLPRQELGLLRKHLLQGQTASFTEKCGRLTIGVIKWWAEVAIQYHVHKRLQGRN